MPTAVLILRGGITPRGVTTSIVEPFVFGAALRDIDEPFAFGDMRGSSVDEPFDFGFFAAAEVVEPFNFGANVRAEVVEPFDFGSSGSDRGGGGYLGTAPASPILGFRDRPL